MIVHRFACGVINTHLYAQLRKPWGIQAMARPSSDLAAFREIFSKSNNIAIITGAGVSAESGVPTFRGAGGYWRKWQAQDLATPTAFAHNPSCVWEFYHYRREVMLTKNPNAAHLAIAECEERLSKQDRKVTIITQNIDELHRRAGSKNLLEIHGSLFKTRCTMCGHEEANYKSPICAALEGRGAPDPDAHDAQIPVEQLPRCEQRGCNGLLRPAVVWFDETLDADILSHAEKVLDNCDLCLVVGTSSVVYPAAMFAPQVAVRGVPVAEFNMENTPATERFKHVFIFECGNYHMLYVHCSYVHSCLTVGNFSFWLQVPLSRPLWDHLTTCTCTPRERAELKTQNCLLPK